jgi:large subunit ribosomal protein L9
MKVLLIKDVYKLGRAGDVKKVADGFGRNYLLPQGLAVLATAGAMKQVEHIRSKANASREALNTELGGVAAQLTGVVLTFSTKAGETGKLYGSITTQMIADELTKLVGSTIDRKVIECQPIRTVGEHKARIRLTIDLNPEIKIHVLREGETELETEAAPKEKKSKKSSSKAEVSEEKTPEDASTEGVDTSKVEVTPEEKKPSKKSVTKTEAAEEKAPEETLPEVVETPEKEKTTRKSKKSSEQAAEEPVEAKPEDSLEEKPE